MNACSMGRKAILKLELLDLGVEEIRKRLDRPGFGNFAALEFRMFREEIIAIVVIAMTS